ncbi:hypothetical protein HMPREF9551_04307 [Escherichia coli MS 196-1]|nr:hypothetical protein HMPREF9551_04307 [Escherichia coli MS 196-1]
MITHMVAVQVITLWMKLRKNKELTLLSVSQSRARSAKISV